ncbi:MAG: cytochrome c-type biogenesis protein CcmH [Rhizobiaceae bacterium]|nr:cytochrome c-type biogenesis protein CcmH [Rhizobiaceae bacterium]
MLRAALLAVALAGAALPALAVQPDEVLADPALEARARAISANLRCMVCQNQSIDDSNAELARDLRVLVRERLLAGDTDEQVYAFVVARYGEFVLLKPAFSARNAMLWATPVVILLAGGVFLMFRRRRAQSPARALTADEEARLRELLRDG